MATKADFRRFFEANIGRVLETIQVRPDGRQWVPGPRTVARHRAQSYKLDGSTVAAGGRNHFVTAVTDQLATVEWRDDDGELIHTTTYRVVGASE